MICAALAPIMSFGRPEHESQSESSAMEQDSEVI